MSPNCSIPASSFHELLLKLCDWTPSKLVAVIRYSGSRSEKSNIKKADELKAWIQSGGEYDVLGVPRSAGYDPPWTLPPFRRNEMMIDLVKKGS